MTEFYSGATEQFGRLTEGLLLRRLHPTGTGGVGRGRAFSSHPEEAVSHLLRPSSSNAMRWRRSLQALPSTGHSALRDRTLLLFLYNTGARVQEAAGLRIANLQLEPQPRVNLHGKGDKWRTCPLWPQTARLLRELIAERASVPPASAPVSHRGRAGRSPDTGSTTRATAYGEPQGNSQWRSAATDISARSAAHDGCAPARGRRRDQRHSRLARSRQPRHNHRYAEINMRSKEAALEKCAPPVAASAAFPRRPVWRDDAALLNWLAAL